jgi:putative transposase
MRTFEYRLYPNTEQSRLLLQCLTETRQLYHEMLETVKAQYAEHYQVMAVEKLSILNMVQNHALAKSIMDASWGAFLDILSEKAARAGHTVVRVNPRFTSQKCSKYGENVQKSLSVRTHLCPFCGYIADRDVNAAKNILLRARALPSGTVSGGSPVELRSPRL